MSDGSDSRQLSAEHTAATGVFLCHSSVDKTSVRQLSDDLRHNGFDPWLDEEKLLPGQDWELEIRQAVRDANVVLVCLSTKSVSRRGYLHKEIKLALDVADEQPAGAIFLIPLRLDECEVPERLRRWHWVDLFHPAGLERLRRALVARAKAVDGHDARAGPDRGPADAQATTGPKTSVPIEIPDLIEMMRLLSPSGQGSFTSVEERLRGLLHRHRIVYIRKGLDDALANRIVAQMLDLEHQAPAEDIHLYLEPKLGSTVAGLAIYDTMQFVRPDIRTYALVGSAGMSTLLLAAGTRGKRYGLQGITVGIRLRSPRGFFVDSPAYPIQQKEVGRMRQLLAELVARHTGRPVDMVAKDSDAERTLSVDEALRYGIIDKVLPTRFQLYDVSAQENIFREGTS